MQTCLGHFDLPPPPPPPPLFHHSLPRPSAPIFYDADHYREVNDSHYSLDGLLHGLGRCVIDRDREVPQMTTSPQSTSPRIWEDLAPGAGPRYGSLLCLGPKNRTSSPLQVLNFRGLVWTAGTVLPVLPIPGLQVPGCSIR